MNVSKFDETVVRVKVGKNLIEVQCDFFTSN